SLLAPLFFLLILRPPRRTLFPYTTLFRSDPRRPRSELGPRVDRAVRGVGRPLPAGGGPAHPRGRGMGDVVGGGGRRSALPAPARPDRPGALGDPLPRGAPEVAVGDRHRPSTRRDARRRADQPPRHRSQRAADRRAGGV